MSVGDGLLSGDTEDVAMTGEAVVSEKIVQLGRKLGMNTDLRRAVFYSIITSDVCDLWIIYCIISKNWL